MSESNNALDLVRGAISAQAARKETKINCENYKDDAKDKLQLLNAAKKAMENEISDTIKDRRKAVEEEYEKPFSKAESALEKAQVQKDKAKQKAVSARIKTETLDLKQENKRLHAEIKESYKEADIPTVFTRGFFFRLISPHGLKELLFFLCIFIISIFLVPLAAFLFVPNRPKWVLFLLIAIFAALSVFSYIMLHHATKGKNPNVIIAARRKYDIILVNRKKIDRISRAIGDDGDESSYNLAKYDEILDKAKTEYDDRKFVYEQAMDEFEKFTRPLIEQEIRKKHSENIASCQTAYDKAKAKSEMEAEKYQAKVQYIQDHYLPVIGRHYMKEERLFALEELLSKDPGLSLEEAIETLKSRT